MTGKPVIITFTHKYNDSNLYNSRDHKILIIIGVNEFKNVILIISKEI